MLQETRIKVLYIHQDGLITGSAISLFNLLMGLRSTVVDPVLILSGDGPAKAFFESLGIPVHVIPMQGFWTTPGPRWYQRGALKNFKALVKNKAVYDFVSELNPDIIHINDKAALNAGLSLRSLNIPIVQHLRSSYYTCNFPLFRFLSAKIIQHYASYLIGISEDEIDEFETAPNLEIIYNSVDSKLADHAVNNRSTTRASLGLGPDVLLIGYVGIFSGIRGAWDFMEVAARLLESNPRMPLKFIMLGNLPATKAVNYGLFDRLRSEKPAWETYNHLKDKLKDHLITPGYTNDPLRFIAAMDLLVVTSHLGVLGRQPLEAQSVGVPVVSYYGHSGKTKVVTPDTGILVRAKSLTQMATSISALLSNTELRKKLSLHAIDYSRENFDPIKNAQRVVAIYKNLLNPKPQVV